MEFIKPYTDVFEDYMKVHRFGSEKPASLFEPLDYLLDLGGKRIRPAMALMACDLYRDDLDPALPVAMAVELFHNFSLMHDDIMDEADLRRGKATVHRAYDENSAILSGDMMLIKAYTFLEKVEDRYFKKAVSLFNKTAEEVCRGQRMDMDFEHQSEVAISDYILMITYKTAVLLAASMQLGGLVSGAPKEDQHHLYEFGKNIGIAFQIQDDILDAYGDERTGKRVGGDIVQNKKTYLFLKALELSGPAQREELASLYGDTATKDAEKIDRVLRIFDSLVVREYALQVMEAYKDLALSHLAQLHIAEDNKMGMKKLTEYLIARNV